HELYPLLRDLQRGRDRRVPAVGKERLRFQSGTVEAFDDVEGLADIRPGGAVHLVIGDDPGFAVVVAGLGYMDAISRPFMPEGCAPCTSCSTCRA
ncbi:MAG: hypothetical protein WDK95_15225, partial [Syntrophorhabdaceae bacterium]